ncbi:MAG: hypothetical protein ACI87W_001266 [Halieaceae bacterium]|jgi:hypothetical protein
MNYLVIVLIVLLALAPLWHFMPSKRQRRQASLREQAALAGLFVEFRDIPLPPARKERLSASERQVLYYGRRLPASRSEPRSRAVWWREGDAWSALPPGAPPPGIVADLPLAVLAIGVAEDSCGIFWQEDGDAETVGVLVDLLACWHSSFCPP